MNKRVLWALLLIALLVIVFILNARAPAAVGFGFFEIKAIRSVIFLGFTAVGVVIGVLLK